MKRSWVVGVSSLVAALACSDSVLEPDAPGTTKPPAELTIIRLPATTPPLFNDSVAFYAKVGRDDEGFIYFQKAGGGRGEAFARLRIRPRSLLAKPGGSPFGANDSILIVMRVRDPRQLVVELSPSGLAFSSTEPAELKIEYAETNGDLDGDGDTDGHDGSIEQLIAIWRQENPGDPFVKIGTVKTEGARELKAELSGFSRYAVAY